MTFDDDSFRDAVIAALRLRPAQFRLDMKMGDVDEWDSVAHLGLIAELESRFGYRFSLDEISELTSLNVIRRRLAARS